MRIYHFSLMVFFAVTFSVVQFFDFAKAEDVFARPKVFDRGSTSHPWDQPVPQPTYIVVPPASANDAGSKPKPKADPNMPREVFLDTGGSDSDEVRKPSSKDDSKNDGDDEERYSRSRSGKKKKSKTKHSDNDTDGGDDDFVEVN